MTRYSTIVADPPWDHSDGTGWKFGVGDTKKRPIPGGPVKRHLPYATMGVDEIAALPVSDMADVNAHLYLWTTQRFLEFAPSVIRAWGFRPSATLVWCKEPFGFSMGGTFGSTVEFVVFARRGNLAALRRESHQWFRWPRRFGPPVKEGESRQTMHSAKPEAFLDLVESVSPGPYLEMFARRDRLGWDTWGNESLGSAEVAA